LNGIVDAAAMHKGERLRRLTPGQVVLVLLEELKFVIDSNRSAIAFCILPSYSGLNVSGARARKVLGDLYGD
jgi:hypothetical protein